MKPRKIEFWVITALFFSVALHWIMRSFYDIEEYAYTVESGVYSNVDPQQHPNRGKLGYWHLQEFERYLFPQLRILTVYLSFLFMNYYVYPKLFLRKKYVATILLGIFMVLVILASFTALYHFQTYYSQYISGFQGIIFLAVLSSIGIIVYLLLKAAAIHQYHRIENPYLQASSQQIKREATVVGAIWLGVLLLLIVIFGTKFEVPSLWFTQIPLAYLLYTLNRYWLLPEYEHKNQYRFFELNRQLLNYALKLLVISLLIFAPFMLILGPLMMIVFTYWKIHLLIIVPLSTFVYYINRKKDLELVHLKTELGQSSANLDFLRSQINPHFLFNALNTLYGTALQENSERTAQGIQMLGDMMRFMLHENHQHKILLSREIEYMRNYIALQSLRTSSSPDIIIQTNIEDVPEEKFIAPMLLIPFVENAFKHGISLTHKSWIKVTLRCEQGKLFFDVYNSTHARQEQDPEKDKSGVGLENVKQRLALLYPGRHELITRETSEEFFVHLTLEL